ncbi:DMT family transporter [Geodermatophilus nigrescens]|uniref:Permease of the drug/metabolite transporter (DMT) superfamily n=1 Tax=Geodermatophilus nigrescens TaxID=1070870 RepID=A0A1M5HVC5_9ACTN|nr:DMT family transporter [Geodermatophilus nigrescens]SHG19885.1 Permease of the drug/metabolite transporter (DMT) superfamily [Geodermatophilus nigrescens]
MPAGPATPVPPPAVPGAPPAVAPGALRTALPGALAMVFVGGSVAVSGLLPGGADATAQALRYTAACAVLVLLARAGGRPVLRPRGAEWAWLAGVAGAGLVLFNVALVEGAAHAEPAVLGVAVASVPLLLATAGPLLQGQRPAPRVLLAAVVVTAGAAAVQGLGRTDGTGLLWALVVLLCEAAFTLLAVPVLARHGAWGVSVHTTWLAAAGFTVLGLTTEGPGTLLRLDAGDLLAVAYLALAVTAAAFVLWYATVGRMGPGRAGLLTGLAPVAAAAAGVALGGPPPAPGVWAGIALVAAGLACGMTGGTAGGTGGPGLRGAAARTRRGPARRRPAAGTARPSRVPAGR